MVKVEKVEPNTKSVSSLCHYTNLAGLIGILESKQLWASNVAFLNDREELLKAGDFADEEMEELKGQYIGVSAGPKI